MRNKVCIAPFYVRSKDYKFSPHLERSNADFAPHIKGSHAYFALHEERRHSFRDQQIAKIDKDKVRKGEEAKNRFLKLEYNLLMTLYYGHCTYTFSTNLSINLI